MRRLCVLLVLVCLVSCQHPSGPAKGVPTKDSATNKPARSIALRETDTDIDRWHFGKYLSDPNTPQLAKDIFHNTWELKDDEPLDFLERLHGTDKESRPFYFKVVTNSYRHSDGAYSEGLGNAGYEYVRNSPGEFLNYFTGKKAFTTDDLKTWADIVMLEFDIIGEDEYNKPIVKDYLNAVRKKCRACDTAQLAVLDTFSKYLNARWQEFVGISKKDARQAREQE